MRFAGWPMLNDLRHFRAELRGISPEGCYSEIAYALARSAEPYYSRLGEAMLTWGALYA